MSLRFNAAALIKRFERSYDVHNHIEVLAPALKHNLQLFTDKSGLAVFPVLKGNAYGHGIEQVAGALRSEKIPYIAVDGYFEALRIRDVSRQPVLVMGAIKPSNFSKLHYNGFAFVVQHIDTIRALGKTGKKLKVHLEVNTGMNRYGVQPDHVKELAKAILKYRNLELEGIMSHLADSDGGDWRTIAAAVKQFDEAVEIVHALGIKPKWLHVSQTAGSAVAASRYANAMRLGIGLYGIDPFPAASSNVTVGLQPALKLVSTITNIIKLQKGDKVSYNYTFTAPRAMRIGVLPLGYYEGIDRRLSNSGCVKLGEIYLPIVGRVCMNHTMVDLSAADESGMDLAVGDEVVVYSDQLADKNSLASIAAEHGLFNYGLLVALSPDVRRTIIR